MIDVPQRSTNEVTAAAKCDFLQRMSALVDLEC